MNDKKDDSKRRFDPNDDTASLLESLFQDTKSSQIKVVRRRIRPKQRVKKRVISKQRKDERAETSRTPLPKESRPSTLKKRAEVTNSRTRSREKPQPGSIVPRDPKTGQIRQKIRKKSTLGVKPTFKPRQGEGQVTARPSSLKKESPPSKKIASPGEERTEALDQSVLNSMISMVSGIKGSQRNAHSELSSEEKKLLKTKKSDGEKVSEPDDLRSVPPAGIEEITGTDEEITEVMGKTTIESMISDIEGHRKEEEDTTSAKKSPVDEEDETDVEIFFDSSDQKEEISSDVGGITQADEEITEVIGKTTLDSMISEIEGRKKEADHKVSAKESPVDEEEEEGVEIFFDSDDPGKDTSVDIDTIAGANKEITGVLEKSTLNTMISALEGSGKEGDDKTSAEESPADEEEETGVDISIENDDLEEEVSADMEGIHGAIEEDPLSQEKPAAPASITIEDSLLETGTREAYPESTLEEKSIPEERKEVVEEAPQVVDMKEDRPSDSANIELTKEKILTQEKPAASASLLSEIPGIKADMLEVHHILEEDKEERLERDSDAVDLEVEPLPDASGPVKEETQFQEIPVPNVMSFEDSTVSTAEEMNRYGSTTEEESMPVGEEGDIEGVSEPLESGHEESTGVEESIVVTDEELQSVMVSGRRSKVIKIGLPLLLFAVFAVILGTRYLSLDFFSHERTQKPASDKAIEDFSPNEQEISQKTLRETAPTPRQGGQPSTPLSAEKEIIRAPVPKKQDTTPKTQKETAADVTPKTQPSTSEPTTIVAMKERKKESSPLEQNTAPKISKETSALAEQEVRPESSGAEAFSPPSDTAVKAEVNQKETPKLYPYSVYLGSYSSLDGVERALLEYSKNGLSSLYWQEVDLGDKGIWYRVFSGQFETKGEAEEYIKQRQLVDAEVQKTKQGASVASISVKDVAPQAKAPAEKQNQELESTVGSFHPYSVYAGSYKGLDRARKAVSDLEAKGPSYWVKTDLGDKGIWYRVYVGCFETRDQAETFIKNNQIADGESRHTAYANFIGTYHSDEELDKMRLSLLNLEFSPYVIEASGGEYHLFTGAYYQRTRAEKEHFDLKEKGIQSQIVKR